MKKNPSSRLKTKKLILFLMFIFILTSGFSCTKTPGSGGIVKPVKLVVWGVYEDSKSLELLFKEFKKLYPTVSFEYRKFEPQEYEQKLINAWVDSTDENNLAPDIYFLQNSLINQYKNRISPLPEKIKLPYTEVKKTGFGSFQKTDISHYTKEVKTLTLNQLSNSFAPVVYNDVVINNKIYGLPLSLNTMALFYNKKMFDYLNVDTPPKNWNDFAKYVKELTLLNEDKTDFIQSGTAMGTTANIANAVDILILLMKQSGIQVNNNNNLINFGSNEEQKATALSALTFYTDFANPIKETYSWTDTINPEEINALSRFREKSVAFFFGYPYDIEKIDSKWYEKKKSNPSPDAVWFDIAPMPQITTKTTDASGNTIEVARTPINFADYWVMTVSHKTKNKDVAWGFIDFATREKNVKLYLDQTNRPTALTSYFNKQIENNPAVSVFAQQIKSATSWYHGTNYSSAKNKIQNMIETFRTNSLDSKSLIKLLNDTATNINQDIK